MILDSCQETVKIGQFPAQSTRWHSPPESGGAALSTFALYAAERGFSFVSAAKKRNSKIFACSPIALFIIICYNQGRNLSVQFGRE